MTSRKQALLVLQSTAALISVPLLQEAIGVALMIVEVCEVREILGKLRDSSWFNAIKTYLPSNKRSRICKIGYAVCEGY